jgi:signal transduction histidine kinase
MIKKNKLILINLITSSVLILLLNSSFTLNSKFEKINLVQIKTTFVKAKKENPSLLTNVCGISYSFKNMYVLLNHVFSKTYVSRKVDVTLHNLFEYSNKKYQTVIFSCIFNNTIIGFIGSSCEFLYHKKINFIYLDIFSFLFRKWVLEIIIFLVLAILTFYLFFKNSRIQQYSQKKYLDQKKYIEAERQRISSEMHDEIGAGLSAIKLFSELASKNRKDVDEIRQINVMVNDIADKINEIIWSTNADSDNLESLFYFIEGQSRKLFEHSNISFTANLPIHIPEIIITSQIRRNSYLMVKEIVHNALKHSKATKVHLAVNINNGLILYTIKDNGVGFDPSVSKLNAMGLANVKLRIEKLKGSLVVENYKGTVILIKIPLESMSPLIKSRKLDWLFFKKDKKIL